LLKCSYSTTFKIIKDLKLIIERQLPADAIVVPSSLFIQLFGRRTRETPADEHPRAEEEAAARKYRRPVSETLDAVVSQAVSQLGQGYGEDFEKPEFREILSELANEPVHFNQIAERTGIETTQLFNALTQLQLDGLAVRQPGDWFLLTPNILCRSSKNTTNEEIDIKKEGFIAFLSNLSHRIGRKYLQLYLALHWFLTDKERWTKGRLLETCLRSGPISERDILAYSSGLNVQLV